jgi:hypothetical protein
VNGGSHHLGVGSWGGPVPSRGNRLGGGGELGAEDSLGGSISMQKSFFGTSRQVGYFAPFVFLLQILGKLWHKIFKYFNFGCIFGPCWPL